MNKISPFRFGLLLCLVSVLGCHTDMWVQPRVGYQQKMDLFDDTAGSRPIPEGVVKFGTPDYSIEYLTGRNDNGLVTMVPFTPTLENILDGEEDYRIHCAVCHGVKGDGNGMIAQRGFDTTIPVASFQTERMRNLPIGHTFEVLTDGFGAMPSFASRLTKRQRWQIALYVRVLQTAERSDRVVVSEVREEINSGR